MIHIRYNSISLTQSVQFLLRCLEILIIRSDPNLHDLLVYFGRLLNMRNQILALKDSLLELPSPLDRASVDILRDDHTHQIGVVNCQPLFLRNSPLRLLQGRQIIKREREK